MTEQELEDTLARPTPLAVQAMRGLSEGLLILGAGGKMGPSLVRLARRAARAAGCDHVPIVAVSRFSAAAVREALVAEGAQVLAGDLNDAAFRRTLPAMPNVLFMLGHKFSHGDPPGTYWMMNTVLPAILAEQFRPSRIVCFSSGNVYSLTPLGDPAPTEDAPAVPVGEYGWSVLGRERVLQYAAARHGTPVCLLRLNYAVEARYGVLVDLAQDILAGRPISLAMPQVNFIWQGYANAVALASFSIAASPARVLNVTGLARHNVRELACRLGEKLGRQPDFVGPDGNSALVSDAARCHELFGPPEVDDDDLLNLVAAWLGSGGRTLGKPTKFQVTDGKF